MKSLIPLCSAAFLLAACGPRDEAPTAPTGPAAPDAPAMPSFTSHEGRVNLAPTQGHNASGTLTLRAEGDAVRLTGSLQGLPPNGEFGFHIHEYGDCSAPDASSAGNHFNPSAKPHGNPSGMDHHAGDMMNVKSDAEGKAEVSAYASGVTLNTGNPDDVLGKAVVLHEKADDYATQPSGNSGARIACGVIALVAQ